MIIMERKFIIGAIVVILATYIATQAVERFYPDINMEEVNRRIEVMGRYGSDNIGAVDMVEGHVRIEKTGMHSYTISDRKTKILNGMYTVFVFEILAIITITGCEIVIKLQERRKRGSR